jgi:hypothetical protein
MLLQAVVLKHVLHAAVVVSCHGITQYINYRDTTV